MIENRKIESQLKKSGSFKGVSFRQKEIELTAYFDGGLSIMVSWPLQKFKTKLFKQGFGKHVFCTFIT